MASVATPSTITLMWDRNPEREVTGYRVYFGPGSRQYVSSLDVGNATSALFTDLASGVDHFFAVTAHDEGGLESAYSAEAHYRWEQTDDDTPSRPGTSDTQIHVGNFANGVVLLTVTGLIGRPYAIEATQDWITWSTIATVTVGPNRFVDYVDKDSWRFPGRYYRHSEVLPNAPLQISAAPDGSRVLTILGTAGQAYDIEATTDFQTWTTIGSVTVADRGSVDFVDHDAARYPERFYRHTGAGAPILVRLTFDAGVKITVTGTIGQIYDIEATEDFRTWITLGRVTAGADGLANYVDAEAARHPIRFYRALQQL